MNDVVCIKLCSIIIAIVHSIYPDLSFTCLPVFVWCATSHSFCLGGRFLIPLPTSCENLLVWMGTTLCPRDQKYPLGSIFKTYFPSLFLIFLQMFEFSASCFLFHSGSNLQWRLLESCWNLSIFYLRQWSRLWHTSMRNLQVPGCLVLKKKNFFLWLMVGMLEACLGFIKMMFLS